MKKIKLKYTELFALIDDEDYQKVKGFVYLWDKNRIKGNKGYAYRFEYYPNVSKRWFNRKRVFLHNDVLGVETKISDGLQVDHINRDSLDNRKANLRIVSFSENQINKGLSKRNSSGYKGVSWHERDKIFRAAITYNSIKYCLGNFKKAEEAALAYNKKAKELSAYAWLNPIPKVSPKNNKII